MWGHGLGRLRGSVIGVLRCGYRAGFRWDRRRCGEGAYPWNVMSNKIHPSSVVSPEVELGDDVVIGPQCSLDGRITVGNGTRIAGHNYFRGPLVIGERNQIYPFVCLGFEPQDSMFDSDSPCAGLRIGDDNILREQVTMHRSTSEEVPTVVGDRNMFMVGAHVAHDCTVGSRCVVANNVSLAGHVRVDDQVTIGGGTAVAQRLRVGRLAFIGGGIGIPAHFPPFMMGRRIGTVNGINALGMRRAGFDQVELDHARWAYQVVFCESSGRPQILETLAARANESSVVREILEFMRELTGRLCRREA